MSVRASVVIPCHDKVTTLPLALDTVLRQSVSDLEVLLLGDGVTPEVRAVIGDLVAGDPRVRFLDFPKGPNHGEAYRHDAVLAAASDAIFYLCDDDLLLPEHVADLLALLEGANFVQSLNGYVHADGSFETFAADLSLESSVRAILQEDLAFNSVSLTGTAHSREFYLAAGRHWETTPAGEWPDHHQWKRMMRDPAFRGATSGRLTAVQLPTSADDRDTWTPQQRLAELARWHEVVISSGGQSVVDRGLAIAAIAELAVLRPAYAETVRHVQRRDETLVRLRRRVRRLSRARRRSERALAAVRSSRSWRVTAPLRAAGRVLRRVSRARQPG